LESAPCLFSSADWRLSSFRPFLELVSILLFLLGPEMLKNADSPRLERGKSPLELRTLLKSQPDNLYASSPPRRDPWPQGTQCTWFPGHPLFSKSPNGPALVQRRTVPLQYQMDMSVFQTYSTKIRGVTGLFHRAPSRRLAATQPNTHAEIRAEISGVPGSCGPLSPTGVQVQGSAKRSARAFLKTAISIQTCAGCV